MSKQDDYNYNREFGHVQTVHEAKLFADKAVTAREMAEIDAMIQEGMQKIHDEPIKNKAMAEQYQSNTRQAIWTVLGLTLVAAIVVYLSWGGQ